MGITPTERTKTELSGAAAANQASVQTALAKGVTAQQQGTEVAALSYFFQAAAFEPALLEASSRSSILAANISSGNIGANIRNDIEWRKQWVAKLTLSYTFSRKQDNSVVIAYNENNYSTVTFNAVKAADISDNLTIRIASVNGAAPQNARFQIAALPGQVFQESFTILQIENGVVKGFDKSLSASQRARYKDIDLYAVSFETITSIRSRAFYQNQLTGITIGANVRLGKDVFDYNKAFENAYANNNCKAGTYTLSGGTWTYKP